ncbi:MAG TPA: penicillin-binding protein 1A [Thermomonas sp.]|uniref:penicillin-binding protein 1A n=1 Tax=Thermomonas sp. TaxID=1971895 RepID=UPI002CDCFB71|nr:penicillin-binding protein 1A [Thermomonas sp.]HOV96644.1 penicillin-binding protein 1A [Thermomonas sp.]
MPRFFRFLRWFLLLSVAFFLIGALVLGAMVYAINARLPDVQSLRHIELQEPMYVYARDGRLIGLFGEMRRYPVDITKVPARVKQAFLAAEDANFYEHNGVDFTGIARAVWLLAKTGGQERVAGGSTITQQVAKQFFLSSEYSFKRKFAEMLLAMKMERELSKDEIFELYLNKSFFGNRAYGVAAAAEYYYGKTLDQLNLDEAATLAGIPKFPSSGNPISNPDRARIRRDNYILPRMAELGFASRVEVDAARQVPMHAAPHERQIEVYAPYVAEMVRQQMVERYGGDVLNKGYHVTTTIDPVLQAAADRAVVDGLRVYDRRHGWRKPEKTVQIPAGADDKAIGQLLHTIPVQGGLLPAVVTGTDGGQLQLVLADGSTMALSGSALAWTGKPAAALAQRGDVVRLRHLPAATGKPDAPAQWELDQLPRAQVALVSLDADNGALRALVGGYSFAGNKFNRATQARRQPGSSFKPFLYAAAMERGFNPASIVLDAPVVFKDRKGHEWRPQNDGGNFAGPMRLREALVQSRNLVSVRLLDTIGVDYARRYISHFGFDEASLPPNLSMSLGTASLTPMSVARGYTVFANGGFLTTPWVIDSVRDRAGKEIFKENPATACPSCAVAAVAGQAATPAPTGKVDGFDLSSGAPAPTANPAKPAPATAAQTSAKPANIATAMPPQQMAPRAIDPRVAWQLASMMRDVVKRGTATAARVLNRDDVGGKTGSTNDHRDAWFSGFGGPYVTTVWVGRDDFQSLGYREYGGKAALPIWINYMQVALKDQPLRLPDPPDGMVKVSVSASGRLLPGVEGGITEWVKAEDLQRMEEDTLATPDSEAQPPEESFDIF